MHNLYAAQVTVWIMYVDAYRVIGCVQHLLYIYIFFFFSLCAFQLKPHSTTDEPRPKRLVRGTCLHPWLGQLGVYTESPGGADLYARMQHVPNQINNNKFVSFFSFFLFTFFFPSPPFFFFSLLFICLFVSFFTRCTPSSSKDMVDMCLCERERPPRASENMSPVVAYTTGGKKPEGGNRKYSLGIFGVPACLLLLVCTIGDRTSLCVCVSVCVFVICVYRVYWSPTSQTLDSYGFWKGGMRRDTRGLWWQSVRTPWCLRHPIWKKKRKKNVFFFFFLFLFLAVKCMCVWLPGAPVMSFGYSRFPAWGREQQQQQQQQENRRARGEKKERRESE